MINIVKFLNHPLAPPLPSPRSQIGALLSSLSVYSLKSRSKWLHASLWKQHTHTPTHPNHYPFNVFPPADSGIYGTALYLPIKPFIVSLSSMAAVTWFSHFLWGPSLYHWGEDKAAHHRCLPKYGPAHKSIMASGILEIPQQREETEEEGGRRLSISDTLSSSMFSSLELESPSSQWSLRPCPFE